jgi:mevalonate kinase
VEKIVSTTASLVRARIPGKFMLAGEYAVLWGGKSLACSIDRYMDIAASLGEPGWVELHSMQWEKPLRQQMPLKLEEDAPLLLHAAAEALSHYSLPGLSLRVDSQLQVRDGFGSSSALCLGTMLAAEKLSYPHSSEENAQLSAARFAYQLQKKLQGFASGYDIATQLCGGLVLFSQSETQWPEKLQQVPIKRRRIPDLISLYTGGQGAPTALVGVKTSSYLRENYWVSEIVKVSNELVESFLQLLSDEQGNADSWQRLLKALHVHRSLFVQSPAYPQELMQELAALPGFDRRWSAKTTGAGGEDAILVLGTASADRAEADRVLRQRGWSCCDYQLAGGAEIIGGEKI